MQEGALNSSGGLTATSWPHAFHRHILQLGTGFLPGSDCSDELSIRLLQESTKEIIGVEEADFFPNFFMPFMDASKVSKGVLFGAICHDRMLLTAASTG